jgi:hypothetical protein
MAYTDAQKEANERYRKANVTQKTIRFYPTEADLIAHVEKQPKKQTYIKDLIRADMEKNK